MADRVVVQSPGTTERVVVRDADAADRVVTDAGPDDRIVINKTPVPPPIGVIDTASIGPAGPVGPPGPPGQPEFVAQGPPSDVIPGARPGVKYLDELTGAIYTMGG